MEIYLSIFEMLEDKGGEDLRDLLMWEIENPESCIPEFSTAIQELLALADD